MELFNKLKFKTHRDAMGGTQAHLVSDNGYGVSVITGSMFHTSEAATDEVAIKHGDELCYDTHITDDVLEYQTAAEVNEIMRQVEELPAI